jgi:CrcB protein
VIERMLLVGIGGAVGSMLRYLVALGAEWWLGPHFPWGTLAVNLAGAFGVGLVQEFTLGTAGISDHTRLFLTTGMIGGLTTYSTFSYETVRLLEAEAWRAAALNVLVTTVVSLVLCFAGVAAGRALVAPRG